MLITEPPVSMVGRHCPCQPIAHAPPSQPCPTLHSTTGKNLEDGTGGTGSQPGLDEKLEMEEREGLSNKTMAGLGIWSLSRVGIYKY